MLSVVKESRLVQYTRSREEEREWIAKEGGEDGAAMERDGGADKGCEELLLKLWGQEENLDIDARVYWERGVGGR